ncbi:MAG: IS4 family transposase [Taibaiella sp.]|nr:IS4 family transposase [Taibaiella sp.]
MAYQHTVLREVLKLIPRHEIEAVGQQFHVGQKFRKINHYSHFVTLFVAQLAGTNSLRELVSLLSTKAHFFYHLGLRFLPRSTLARVTNEQPAEMFQQLYFRLVKRLPLRNEHRFRFKRKLLSIDATTISLCLACYSWATFRKQKGGVKLHVGLDHGSMIPAFVNMTTAREHEIRHAQAMTFESNTIYVMDRGYCDYDLFQRIDGDGAGFVTRLKSNAKYRIIRRNKVNRKLGVTSDQWIQFTGPRFNGLDLVFRRIGYKDAETGKQYIFITNEARLAATTIAAIYKDRWQIELFFKWVKQNLRIKKFFGRSENAVLSQIWIAMIAYLIFQYLRGLLREARPVLDVLRAIRHNLFLRCSLHAVLHPKHEPAILQVPQYQLSMW